MRVVLRGELPRTESKPTRHPSDARVSVEVQRSLQVERGSDLLVPRNTREVGGAHGLLDRATVPLDQSEKQFDDAG